ncbi:hypothetical protein C8R45DRAFT_985361 [Mycena sanguinolenta]|nr:hypothetical protein C8R45DRAFT_985361 [Mycena sanguinolenta]
MSTPEGRNLQQTEGLWFSNDALVVLSAGDQIFRVPRSILAARSSVFQAMFEFPQPTADANEMSDTIDGSPVIRLHDDPVEVEAFLRAIFDSSYFMPPPNEVEFSELLGILQLAHKYDVGYLYKRAISHLETLYPFELTSVGSVEDSTISNADWDIELRSLDVFHQVGATWLLPFAYHSVVEYRLTDRDWGECPAARKEMIFHMCTFQRSATDRLYNALTPASQCPSKNTCNLAKFSFLKRRRWPDDISLAYIQAPLRDASAFRDKPFLFRDLCPSCADVSGLHYDTVRAQIWSELPANCGLESWDVLLEQRKAALA